MFEYLQQIDNEIYQRYLTLEKDIKSANNSFYDSYLNLQEHFIKKIVEENAISIGRHESCGWLLKRADVKELFLVKYGLDEGVYNKMVNYAKKTNEHKHEKEKNIEVDTIVNHMQAFYAASSVVAIHKGLNVPQFNGKYFKDMFGKMAKTDERLEELEHGQQVILQSVEDMRKQLQLANSTNKVDVNPKPKSQRAPNVKLNGQLQLKNFIANSEKQYYWMGTNEDFTKSKKTLIGVQLALIVVGIISTIVSSVCFKLYSTFTLFENIVVFGTFFLLSYATRTKKLYPDTDLAKYNADVMVLDEDKIWRYSGKEKKRYRTFRIIAYFAIILNIICIWFVAQGSLALKIAATILEAAFLGLTVASSLTRESHYCMYGTIFMSGYNASGSEKVTIVYDSLMQKLYLYEDYKTVCPFELQ